MEALSEAYKVSGHYFIESVMVFTNTGVLFGHKGVIGGNKQVCEVTQCTETFKLYSCLLNVFIWFIHIFDNLFHNLIVYFCLFVLVLFYLVSICHYGHLYVIIYGGNIIFVKKYVILCDYM